MVPGAAVEVRYKGRLAWFPGTITNVSKDRRKGERFDIAYADGDSEKAVPRIRVRLSLSNDNPVRVYMHFFTRPINPC